MSNSKFIVCAVAAGAIMGLGAASALAADMAVKARPMAVDLAYDWSGWYAGLNAGVAISNSRDTVEPAGCAVLASCLGAANVALNPLRTDSASFNGAGFTGGAQAGRNWQTGKWVWGIETDINFSDVRDSNSVNRLLAAPLVRNIVHTESERLNWFGTLRGRLGWTPSSNVLLYGTGGLAYGQVSSASNVMFTAGGDTYVGSTNTTRAGWTLGAGGEWMVARNWTVKAEYLYVDLGKFNYADTCATPAICVAGLATPFAYQTDLQIREHIVRVGVNYKFNWAGPVVAKY